VGPGRLHWPLPRVQSLPARVRCMRYAPVALLLPPTAGAAVRVPPDSGDRPPLHWGQALPLILSAHIQAAAPHPLQVVQG
jgi:hypothetical protein